MLMIVTMMMPNLTFNCYDLAWILATTLLMELTELYNSSS